MGISSDQMSTLEHDVGPIYMAMSFVSQWSAYSRLISLIPYNSSSTFPKFSKKWEKHR